MPKRKVAKIVSCEACQQPFESKRGHKCCSGECSHKRDNQKQKEYNNRHQKKQKNVHDFVTGVTNYLEANKSHFNEVNVLQKLQTAMGHTRFAILTSDDITRLKEFVTCIRSWGNGNPNGEMVVTNQVLSEEVISQILADTISLA